MEKTEKKWRFSQGIFSHNPVFAAGMLLAPAVMIGNTFAGALTYAAVFSSVTLASLMISSLIPRKLPYAARIILYTLITAGVYVSLCIFFEDKLPSDLSKLGVFLPMIITGEFITSAPELRFFRMDRLRMLLDIISHIIGFDAAIIFLGIFRELFSTGSISGNLYGVSLNIPLLYAPCGGFILIGLIGALIRHFKKDKGAA